MNRWDPQQYQRFSRERARPFFDLIGRIPDGQVQQVQQVQTVADLGCGPGSLTQTLCERWPDATVYGVDNSPHMLEKAGQLPANPRLHFIQADLADWQPDTPLDCIISNAALQWVPDHAGVLAHLLSLLAQHSVLAVQMPRNFDEAAHRLLYELAGQDPWAAWLSSKGNRDNNKISKGHHDSLFWQERHFVETPDWYGQTLRRAGLQVEVWETIYHHILEGQDAVLEWMKGTALRPVLSRLPSQQHDAFLAAYGEVLAAAYPPGSHGTPFPFRRLFFVAQR